MPAPAITTMLCMWPFLMCSAIPFRDRSSITFSGGGGVGDNSLPDSVVFPSNDASESTTETTRKYCSCHCMPS